MITNGEQVIEKVIAILPDGSSGAPCGACRELMVQLMPEKYKGVQIMMDYEAESVVTESRLRTSAASPKYRTKLFDTDQKKPSR